MEEKVYNSKKAKQNVRRPLIDTNVTWMDYVLHRKSLNFLLLISVHTLDWQETLGIIFAKRQAITEKG